MGLLVDMSDRPELRKVGGGWIYATLPTRSISVSTGPGGSAAGSTSSTRCQHVPACNAITAAV